jgi:hypothetical protein
MTTTQRNALNVTNGFMICNITTATVDIYQSGAWGSINTGGFETAAFILATTDALLPDSQSIGALTTGLLLNTIGQGLPHPTGTLSTAVAGTDYYSPGNPTTLLDTGGGSRKNLFVGTLCGNASESGDECVGLGINTLTGLTSAVSNIGIGYQAGLGLHAASNNVLIGTQAGTQTAGVICIDSVFVGHQSGTAIANTSVSNVGLGYQTFVSMTSGNGNVAIGSDAAALFTTYESCALIGSGADISLNTRANSTAIGFDASVAINNAIVLGNGANVGIGTGSPAELLQVHNGNIRIDSANALKLYNAGNTNYSALISANVASNITWTLPIVDEPYAVSSNGSGTLSFATPTLGTITGLAAFSGQIANYASTYAAGNASQSTTTVTGSSTTFTAAMVGGVIVFANLNTGFITAFNSTTSLTVDISQSVALQSYIIYYNGLISDNLGNTGVNTLYLNGNGITSYVPKALNYYETFTLNASWTGPVTVTNQNIYLTRIGNVVTMRIQQVTGTSGSATVWTFGSVIPTRFLPASAVGDMYINSAVITGGSNTNSAIKINCVTPTLGTVTAYGSAMIGNFSGSGSITLHQIAASWVIA